MCDGVFYVFLLLLIAKFKHINLCTSSKLPVASQSAAIGMPEASGFNLKSTELGRSIAHALSNLVQLIIDITSAC